MYLPLPESESCSNTGEAVTFKANRFIWRGHCVCRSDTWLRAGGGSGGDVWVTGSYSPLSLLEHLSGVYSTLRDERSRLLQQQNGIKCAISIRQSTHNVAASVTKMLTCAFCSLLKKRKQKSCDRDRRTDVLSWASKIKKKGKRLSSSWDRREKGKLGRKRALSGRGTHVGLFHRFTSLDCFPLGCLVLLLLLLMMSILMMALLTLATFLT